MLDLNWILSPFPKAHFFSDYWQLKPGLLVSKSNGIFEKIFDRKSVEHIIEFCQPKPPSIRISSTSNNGDPEIPFTPNGRINVDHVRKAYLGGQTIILNSVEDYDPNIAMLARSLEVEMNARVQVNCYLTPPASQGFQAHYDTHDVLVMQMEGTKRWKIYGADIACPLHEMIDGGPRPTEDCQKPTELVLQPGDVLYIPRGWVHEAEALDTSSLHITLGIHPPLLKDLMHSAIDILATRFPELRQVLPLGPLAPEENQVEMNERFSAAVQLLQTDGIVQKATVAVDDHILRRGRSGGDGRLFEDAENIAGLTRATKLERRSTVPCRLVSIDNQAGLQFLNSLIKGPEEFREALHYVSSTSVPFQISDLPGLEAPHQLALASTLVSDGLCRIHSV